VPDLAKTRKYIKMVADYRGWEIVSEKDHLEGLIEGLATNLERFGYRSCPCRLATGNKEEDKDIICPCEYAAPDIQDFGQCYCGLFLSKTYVEQGGKVRPIPERRPDEKIE